MQAAPAVITSALPSVSAVARSRFYEPRHADALVLHRVVRDNLLTFLEQATDRRDGEGVPRFIARELRRFVDCGVLAKGFARLCCDGCRAERLVPFSCKGRGFCPSCGGRRMTERAAHLVDAVLPHVPIRQWVLSLPHPLRYLFAFDHALSLKALAIHVRALSSFQRRRARAAGIQDARTGAVTVIQRFASGLRLNVHFHTLLLDGVFHHHPAGRFAFSPLPPPSDAQVARLVATIRRRILRMLRHHGLLGDDDTASDDVAALEPSALTNLAAAAVSGTQAFGTYAGAPILRIGRDPNAPWIHSRGSLHAHLAGFDLHAGVAVAAADRAGLERVCRYLSRPAIAQERLELLDDGSVRVALKAEWSDGTSHLVFEPLELIGRLASFVPRPRKNLVVYHGVLAPNARWRPRAVAYGRLAAPNHLSDTVSSTAPSDPSRHCDRHYRWADLMRRAFGLDVLACDRCGGRLRLLATIHAADAIAAILEHLGMHSQAPTLRPARSPPDADIWN